MAAGVHRQSATPPLAGWPHLWIARSVDMTKTLAPSETHRISAAALGPSTREQMHRDDTVDLALKRGVRCKSSRGSTLAICAHIPTTYDSKAAAAINAASSAS